MSEVPNHAPPSVAAVRDWLRQQPEHRIVYVNGRADLCRACVVARFLQDQGFPHAEVLLAVYRLEADPTAYIPMTSEAIQLRQRIDDATCGSSVWSVADIRRRLPELV